MEIDGKNNKLLQKNIMTAEQIVDAMTSLIEMNQKFSFRKTKETFNFDDALGRIQRRVKIVIENRGDSLGLEQNGG